MGGLAGARGRRHHAGALMDHYRLPPYSPEAVNLPVLFEERGAGTQKVCGVESRVDHEVRLQGHHHVRRGEVVPLVVVISVGIPNVLTCDLLPKTCSRCYESPSAR